MVQIIYIIIGLLIFSLPASAGEAKLSVEQGQGTNPELPSPSSSIIPTVNIAPIKGWTSGDKPIPAKGFAVTLFASELDHPRWLYVLPNGDVLVAESDAPQKSSGEKSIKGFITKKIMQRAGSHESSADRISLLRDADGDGKAETKTAFLENLHSPFGMALVDDTFYIANTDAIMSFPYRTGQLRITDPGTKITDLPAGSLNHHWTKNIIASRDGKFLYATVGSNSNVGENGMDKEKNRAAILKVNLADGTQEVFASGLRNPNGLDWQPQSGELWTVVNERDELGSDLVPDYMTSVREGGFYGWPYSYFGQHIDIRVKPQNPELVAKAISPDYALGPHTAALGLVFYNADLFPSRYKNGAFIGLHGSWNRIPHSGYKVVFVPFKDGRPIGKPEDILTGFLDKDGKAKGRPVGVAVDGSGALLVADDAGNSIWRMTPASR
jgi:glucose/arabinose dehydrogenase